MVSKLRIKSRPPCEKQQTLKNRRASQLELRLVLHLLKDRFHLGSLHNITLDLQLSTHKQLLRIRLSLDEFSKIGIAERHGDCRLLAVRGGAFASFSAVFEINVPGFLCAVCVLEGKGEDGTAFFDGVFALRLVGEGGVDGVKGGRRGEVCCRVVSVSGFSQGEGGAQAYSLRWTLCCCCGGFGRVTD